MPRKETPTLAEAIQQWAASRVDLSPNTLMNDASVLNRFAQHVGPNKRMAAITAFQVESYFVTIRHHKASSYNKAKARIRVFLNYSLRRGWVQTDLLAEVRKKPTVQVERFRLSPIALVNLLEIPTDPRDRGFLAVAMNTGLRANEITGLRIKDVDLDDGELYVWRSKSKADDRLALTPMLDAELRIWLGYYNNSLGEDLGGEMWLFPARRPPRGVDRENRPIPGPLQPNVRLTHTERIIQRSLRLAGVAVRPQEGVHTIRRSVARAFFDVMADQGYDGALRNTAALLGHKSIVTTEHYLGLNGDRRKRDQILRAQDFLPYGHATGDNVVRFPTPSLGHFNNQRCEDPDVAAITDGP